jgi:hypothetical protein
MAETPEPKKCGPDCVCQQTVQVHVVWDRMPRDIMDAPSGRMHVHCRCGHRHVCLFKSWHDAIPPLECVKCKHRFGHGEATQVLQVARNMLLNQMRQKAAMS